MSLFLALLVPELRCMIYQQVAITTYADEISKGQQPGDYPAIYSTCRQVRREYLEAEKGVKELFLFPLRVDELLENPPRYARS